ncbi:ribonuclease P protein subunit [Candidatus Woesearchaeota archaeon]|nr:ribonuclease P protein subunit [Candidatus Woesearchaeota archaeon]
MAREPTYFQGLIGKKIYVVDSTNQQLIGLSGSVVDETKSTLTILTDEKKRKKLLKAAITFHLEGDNTPIPGLTILRRPEERVKQ